MLGGKEKCCRFLLHLMEFEWWSLSGCMAVWISYRTINVLLFKCGLWSSLCKSPEIADDSNICWDTTVGSLKIVAPKDHQIALNLRVKSHLAWR